MKSAVTKKRINQIIRNEYAFKPAYRAAALLHAEGVTEQDVNDCKLLSDVLRVAVICELRDIERMEKERYEI